MSLSIKKIPTKTLKALFVLIIAHFYGSIHGASGENLPSPINIWQKIANKALPKITSEVEATIKASPQDPYCQKAAHQVGLENVYFFQTEYVHQSGYGAVRTKNGEVLHLINCPQPQNYKNDKSIADFGMRHEIAHAKDQADLKSKLAEKARPILGLTLVIGSHLLFSKLSRSFFQENSFKKSAVDSGFTLACIPLEVNIIKYGENAFGRALERTADHNAIVTSPNPKFTAEGGKKFISTVQALHREHRDSVKKEFPYKSEAEITKLSKVKPNGDLAESSIHPSFSERIKSIDKTLKQVDQWNQKKPLTRMPEKSTSCAIS